MECPNCHLLNPPEAQRCDCGYDFVSRRVHRPIPGPRKRDNRVLWLQAGCLAVVSLMLPALYGAVFLADYLDRAATQRYTQSLDAGAAQAVPSGSDRQTARSWLAWQGMRVSEWGPDLRDTGVERAGIPPEQLGGILRGTMEQGLAYGWNEVSVYFYLDRQGKVITHRVEKFHIGS